MFVQTYLTASDVSAFDTDHLVTEYEDNIETATDDQIRNWLNQNGVTSIEIAQREEIIGETIRDIAQDLINAGYPFII